jgi:diguanylate cyclase (GGDEF)-like protein
MLGQSTNQIVIPACPVGEQNCNHLQRLIWVDRKLQDLEAQVRTDPLTGLYNFRHFAEVLDNEMERTRRTFQPCSLIMIDLDHFKGINDRFGHEVGNMVLQQTARLIVASLRKLDQGCRYGGEEFAAILPNTRLALAMEVAERLRHLCESEPVILANEQHLTVTASLGVAVYSGSEFANRQEFVAQADHHLYCAKKGGRNQVMGPREKKGIHTEVTVDEKRALLE